MPDPLAPQFASPQRPPRDWSAQLWWMIPGTLLVVSLLVVGANKLLTRSARPQTTQNFTPLTNVGTGSDNATLVTDDSPSHGPVDASVVIVEFADFQCPYCKEAYPVVRQIMNEYSDRVRFVFRHFPLTDVHPFALLSAEAGQCAWEQGSNVFWAFHDRLYQNQASINQTTLVDWAVAAGATRATFETCLTSGKQQALVQRDVADGVALGVRGTPTFFFNGQRVQGVIPEATFRQVVESLLTPAQ